jgi:hypothetical protein
VLAPSRPEGVREPEEVLLVDRVEQFGKRALDDLIFQRGNAERAPSSVRFGDVHPPCRLRPIGATMNAGVQIGEISLEISPVVIPCYAVHPGCRILFQPGIGVLQQLDRHMMQ